MRDSDTRSYRSLFWPVILIGVGALWLLANLGIIPSVGIAALISLWPLLLIAIGLDMLIGRGSPVIGGLIALLLVGGVLAVAAFGPALGVRLPAAAEVKVERFQAPLDGATSANVRLNTAAAPVELHALDNAEDLIDAEIAYIGQINFDVTGAQEKTVLLEQRGTVGFDFSMLNTQRLKWDIGLNGGVPLALELDSSSGSVEMNLADLQLSDLRVDSGSGSVSMTLPESAQPYNVAVDSGSGSVGIRLPADTTLTMRLNSGSGAINLNVPADAAVRLEVEESGSGGIHVPGEMQRIIGGDDDNEGVWETSGFDQASRRITIIAEDTGSGSVRLRVRPR